MDSDIQYELCEEEQRISGFTAGVNKAVCLLFFSLNVN